MLKTGKNISCVLLFVGILQGCSQRQPPPSLQLLCLGDSLTSSEYGSYPPYLEQLLAPSGSFRIKTIARPGNTSGEFLEFLKSSLVLKQEKFDIALLMLGTNDARIDGDHTSTSQFQMQLEEIIQLIRSSHSPFFNSHSQVILATIPPIYHIDLPVFDSTSQTRILQEINPAIRKLAARHSLRLADMEQLFSKRKQLLPGVHPTSAGYRAIAEEFAHGLSNFLRRRI